MFRKPKKRKLSPAHLAALQEGRRKKMEEYARLRESGKIKKALEEQEKAAKQTEMVKTSTDKRREAQLKRWALKKGNLPPGEIDLSSSRELVERQIVILRGSIDPISKRETAIQEELKSLSSQKEELMRQREVLEKTLVELKSEAAS